MINLPKIDLKKDEKKTKILIIAVSAFLLIMYFNFLFRPQITRLTGVLSGMGTVSRDLRIAQADISKIDQFRANIEAYREKVEYYEKRLPAEQEMPSILADLSNMAKGSNIKILSITPIPVSASLKDADRTKKRIYQERPILINAKSGYHELGQFLSNLENADRFMKVVDIDVKTNKVTPKKHDVELVVSTFILLNER
ncbi:MAG: type 4a pilus biogenesis protein PilO [Candidatus Omnitrophica bacterium]|nr:type 4a pilus biogenesis protein PilO [Candidatus Omnitrophota bacterium]